MNAQFDSAHWAVAADGHSLIDAGAGSKAMVQLAAMAPINGQLVIANCAIAGQTILDMINNPSDIDSKYQGGKSNVLIIDGLSNNLANIGRSVQETIGDLNQYMAARQAQVNLMIPTQKPWIFVIVLGIPRGDSDGIAAEPKMLECNAYIKANYREMGAAAYVDLRKAGGPFSFTDVAVASNYSNGRYKGDCVHLTDLGTADYAGMVAEVLASLPENGVVNEVVTFGQTGSILLGYF